MRIGLIDQPIDGRLEVGMVMGAVHRQHAGDGQYRRRAAPEMSLLTAVGFEESFVMQPLAYQVSISGLLGVLQCSLKVCVGVSKRSPLTRGNREITIRIVP